MLRNIACVVVRKATKIDQVSFVAQREMSTKIKKRSKRFMEIQKSVGPSFISKQSRVGIVPFRTPRRRVHMALQKYRSLLKDQEPGPGYTIRILNWMLKNKGELVVNQIHTTLGKAGDLQGVEVGDMFESRAELRLVGLHRLPQAGIDWMDTKRKDGNMMSIALSVVVSGRYEDDEDEGETLYYTGEGGNDPKSRHQVKDQKLEGGNLALYNNQIEYIPVRLIRGRIVGNSTSYSYDGLYDVSSYVTGKGKSGHKVYKFKLERQKDQKPLVWVTQQSEKHSDNLTAPAFEERQEEDGQDEIEISDHEETSLSSVGVNNVNDTVEVEVSSEGNADSIEYEVDCIVDSRMNRRRRKTIVEYKVLWIGYPESEATWEPEENLVNCRVALEEFKFSRIGVCEV